MRTGDNVVVIAGNDRGRQGKIIEMDRKNGRVKVESIAMTCFTRKADKNRGIPGRKEKAERFIDISNVMFLDKNSQRCKLVRKNGRRLNKKTGEEV
jgi:large subunit ribosomal protein L24